MVVVEVGDGYESKAISTLTIQRKLQDALAELGLRGGGAAVVHPLETTARPLGSDGARGEVGICEESARREETLANWVEVVAEAAVVGHVGRARWRVLEKTKGILRVAAYLRAC